MHPPSLLRFPPNGAQVPAKRAAPEASHGGNNAAAKRAARRVAQAPALVPSVAGRRPTLFSGMSSHAAASKDTAGGSSLVRGRGRCGAPWIFWGVAILLDPGRL